ncbi:MAG: chemotaxis protein CheB, partial [Limisphaerales bacterium]
MAKNPHPKRDTNKAAKPKRKLSGEKPSLSGDLAKVRKKAEMLRNQAEQLAKTSQESLHKAEVVDKGADDLHHGADDLHQRTRAANTGKRAAGKKIPAVIPVPAVVGIGASAGGFEAARALLEALPVNTGMSFVFVQHLDPTHESQLTGLLQRATKMPVREITNRVKLEPNTFYVIPPNADVAVEHRVLMLSKANRHAGHLPIDAFFKSLANDQGNFAIGVILSGTGHDGTAGLEQIKAEGGITFAQDEKSSKYFPMPQNAITSRCVDYVLPPHEIANELQKIAIEKTRLGIPLLQTEEGTHGVMCSGKTVFPEGLAIGSTW